MSVRPLKIFKRTAKLRVLKTRKALKELNGTFLVTPVYLHSGATSFLLGGYLISQRPLAFLTSSKWPTQQTMLRLLDSVNTKKNTPSKMSIDQRFYE